MAAAEEKMSFILYGSYEEQLNMLTDEQAGKWIKAIYAYVRTGEKHSDDPLVAMLLSVAGHQLDIDARKYAEKKERLKEAARKAGKASAEKRAMKKAEETQRNATVVNDCQRLQPVNVDEDVNVDVDVDEYVDADVDVLDNMSGGGEEEEDCAHTREEVIHIFEGQYQTTQQEYDKFNALADELFVCYGHKQPSNFDRKEVFEYSSVIRVLDDDTIIAVLDDTRAELLRYAFGVAANADRVNWNYIDGIYANFRHRDINCVEDAYRDNWEMRYGSLSV